MVRPRFLTANGTQNEEAAPAESGVHAVAKVAAEPASSPVVTPLIEQVTLIVYGWRNVEPGTLSWVFPSLAAALAAAQAMTNATRWQIVAGSRAEGVDVELERSSGTVLLEEAR